MNYDTIHGLTHNVKKNAARLKAASWQCIGETRRELCLLESKGAYEFAVYFDFVDLLMVLLGPNWTTVSVVEAFALLFWVRKVESRTRKDMVNMPLLRTVHTPETSIFPRHSRLKPSLKMRLELLDRAANK